MSEVRPPKDDMFTLIDEAKDMLLDRPEAERELIYAIAKLEDDLRAAIVLAYNYLKEKNEQDN